jgi:CHAT domain-containing protein/tetratricopeptide (TPR) repeat protein
MHELIEKLYHFVGARTLEESKQFLEEHRELLNLDNQQVDAAWLVFQVVEQDRGASKGVIQRISWFHSLLDLCREVGIEQAFAELKELRDAKPAPTGRQRRSVVGLSRFDSDTAELNHLLEQGRQGPHVAEKLIKVCLRILDQLQPEENQQFYAAMQTNLGKAYVDLTTGNREENLARAIACYQEALRFWTSETAPDEYATVQADLGRAYADKRTGNREENLLLAIDSYQEALRFWTPETAPYDYARTQNRLGSAYVDLPTGDRKENFARGIACYQEALRFFSPETAPLDYADIQDSLGIAYATMSTGNKGENLIRAIACYREALRFYSPETALVNYAMTQQNLGMAYGKLWIGGRKENLERAIVHYLEALRFFSPNTDPFHYAMVQHNLGMCYGELSDLHGGNQEDLSRAIACLQEALRFWAPEISSLDYAAAQNSLGLDYARLQDGNRGENLARAMACYQEALRFWTPETDPYEYAMAQNNLGRAYAHLPTGNREENVNHAIACYQQALRFHTPEVAPYECRGTNRNLAKLYFAQRKWAASLSAYKGAIDAGEQAYRAGLSSEGKEEEIAQNEELYRHAAFSAAQLGNPVEALLLLERGKTRLLKDALQLSMSRPANVPDSVWNAFKQAGTAIRALQSENTAPSGKEQDLLHTFAHRQQMMGDAYLALNLSIEQVRAYAPDFLQEPDIQILQKLLRDERIALVAFCITDQGSIGLVIHRALHGAVQTVEAPGFIRSDLENISLGWVSSYGRYMRNDTPSFHTWLTAMSRLLDELGQRILAPILAVLPDTVEHIVFIPSGGLFILPLHAAPLSKQNISQVCDHYQISYAPSIKVMSDSQAKAAQATEHSLCAIINPQEDSNLVFTSIEGIGIVNLFRESEIYEGKAGTRAASIAGMGRRAYVHFSCHSSYDWSEPRQSGVILADGQLTLADLQSGAVNMPINRLVTLSACETGISDILRRGHAEEYVGIPAGFMLAGVPCVVASLWAVPELSTAILMERFYQNHLSRGMNFVAALHEAQTWVRELSIEDVAQYAERAYRESPKEDTVQLFRYMRHYHYLAEQDPASRPFAHPYYWAAFIVSGM